MLRFGKLIGGAAVALALGAGSAQAAVHIGFDTGGGPTTVAPVFSDGAFSFSADCGVLDCGGFETIGVSGDTGTDVTLMHSTVVGTNVADTGAGDLIVYITRTGLTGPKPESYFSSFTGNNSVAAPPTVELFTYVSFTDELFGGTLLSSFTSSGPGSTSFNELVSLAGSGSGFYSVTEKYVFHAAASNSDASASPTTVLSGISAVVPEPTSWALMILGFGSAGAMLRRRNTVLATR